MCTAELGAQSEVYPAVPEAQVTYPTHLSCSPGGIHPGAGRGGTEVKGHTHLPQHGCYLETVTLTSQALPFANTYETH